jgi:hypothetical protein
MTRFIATRGFIAPRAKLAIERLRPIVAIGGSLVAFGGILQRFGFAPAFGESDHSWTLLIDSTSLAEAEPYGDFLTHPRGHYEVWSRWQRRRAAPQATQSVYQAIACHEYEDFPRGRIIHEIKCGRFIVYADRRLQQELKHRQKVWIRAGSIRSSISMQVAALSARPSAESWPT